MNGIFRFLQSCLGPCRHVHTIRERRQLHGVDVLHFVCENCGHAVPAIERTPDEHQRIVQMGALQPMRTRRVTPPAVVPLESRRDRRHAAAS